MKNLRVSIYALSYLSMLSIKVFYYGVRLDSTQLKGQVSAKKFIVLNLLLTSQGHRTDLGAELSLRAKMLHSF